MADNKKTSYIEAAAIYSEYLSNLNNNNGFSLKEIFSTYYSLKQRDASKMEDEFIDFLTKINEAYVAGKKNDEISEFLRQRHLDELKELRDTAVREETTVTVEDKDGNIKGVRIESTSFDPSNKSNISSKMGSGDFEFNDDSTKFYNQEKEDALANSLIAGRAADRNAEDDKKAGKEHIGTRDVIDSPEPLVVGEVVDELDQKVDKQNVPTFGETSSPSSIDSINDPNNFTFGDDNNGPDDQKPDNGYSF